MAMLKSKFSLFLISIVNVQTYMPNPRQLFKNESSNMHNSGKLWSHTAILEGKINFIVQHKLDPTTNMFHYWGLILELCD